MTGHNYTVIQLYMCNHQQPGSIVEHLPLNHEVMGSNPTWDKIFSHVCAHFGIRGRCGIILPRLWLRGQLQNCTALVLADDNLFSEVCV